MTLLRGISHVAIVTTDLDRLASFYVDLFGATGVVPAKPAADQLWAALRADRAVPPAVVASQPANPAEASPSASPVRAR